MSLRIGVGRGCRPDLRVQAFQFLAGAPVEESMTQSVTLDGEGWMSSVRRSVVCASRVAGIAALRLLVPGIVPLVEKVFCISSLVALFTRQPRRVEATPEPTALPLMAWSEFSLARFLREIAGQVEQPVLIYCGIREIWGRCFVESYHTMECCMELMEVDRSYKRLAKAIARGKIVGNEAIEEAWLKAHKQAARRVAHLLKDLPDTPPLKCLIDFCERNSIEYGRAVEDSAFPVHALSDGHGWMWIVNLNPGLRPKPPQIRHPRVPRDRSVTIQRVMDGRLDTALRESSQQKHPSVICPSYSARPISEISEFPLEAEMEAMCSNDDDIAIEMENQGQRRMEVVLPLYGRQDHVIEEKELSAVERLELSLRGLRLFLAFLPFILLGVFLLLIAYSLDKCHQQAKKSRQKQEPSSLQLTMRKKWVNRMRTVAFQRLLQGCRDGGAAFIKWGQWSSAREDLFPVEFCDVLSALHDNAPVHPMQQTRREILRSFGRPVEDIFEAFEHEPLASGSVAQVHRALYRKNGRIVPVIVKVRHPNVGQQIHQDFQILKPIAGMASRIPTLKNLPLRESVSQFSNTMTAQTDFRVEAAHIRRFGQNFESVKNAIVIPRVIEELVSESVLVETYEEGVSVARFIKAPSELNTKIVTLGVDAYLKMLLSDNFVHTDLHPGNILVREVEQEDGERGLQIVLLDFGLAEELRPNIRKHFISFLNLISKGDGHRAAQHLLQWSDDQQCPDPKAFVEDMSSLFRLECDIHSEAGIDLDAVMKSVLRLARKHSVSIDSGYASLVIGVCIIVGFAHSLDPRVNLMDAATPVLLTYALTGRVVGRLYG